jgi:PTH1 family peptidyl-tRNA hydrolase
MKTILIAGLGNPGKKYAHTRHNAGFMFVDYFFEKFRGEFGFSDWAFKKNLISEISIGKIGKNKIILLKPQTFMNLSGKAVFSTMQYYKIPCRGETSTNLIVAHDEIDLPLEKYRLSENASSAGHNGVKDIIEKLGTKDFARLRIGIENREEIKVETEKYVLGKFTATEMKIVLKLFPEISSELIKNI